MAQIYTKSTTSGNAKCVILDYRQALRYPFHIRDWTRIRVGMAISFTAADSNSNLDEYGDVDITANTDEDRIHFGLKKYSRNFPGAASNEYFLGMKASGSTSSMTFPWSGGSGTTGIGTDIKSGVHHSDGTDDAATGFSVFTQNSSSWDDTSNFLSIIGFDIEIVNKGLSNQQVIFKYSQTPSTSTSKADVEAVLNASTFTTVGTLDFALNGEPYELPDCFFLYLPFGNLRLRVFALDVIRLS